MQNLTNTEAQTVEAIASSNVITALDAKDAKNLVEIIGSTLALAENGIQVMIEESPTDKTLKGIYQTILRARVDLDEVSDFCFFVQEFLESQSEKTDSSLHGRAVQHYHTNYNDIANDEDMHFALNRIKKEVAAANPTLSPTQVIDEAAALVYEKFGGKQRPIEVDREVTREIA